MSIYIYTYIDLTTMNCITIRRNSQAGSFRVEIWSARILYVGMDQKL